MQGKDLSGKPTNVTQFNSREGSVRKLAKSQQSVREKSSQGKLIIANLTFVTTLAFKSSRIDSKLELIMIIYYRGFHVQ